MEKSTAWVIQFFSSDKLSVTRRLDPNAPNGLYTVNYELCWPDGTCHIGQYQFAIQK